MLSKNTPFLFVLFILNTDCMVHGTSLVLKQRALCLLMLLKKAHIMCAPVATVSRTKKPLSSSSPLSILPGFLTICTMLCLLLIYCILVPRTNCGSVRPVIAHSSEAQCQLRPRHITCFYRMFLWSYQTLRLRNTGHMDMQHCAHNRLKMCCEQLAKNCSTVYYFSGTI